MSLEEEIIDKKEDTAPKNKEVGIFHLYSAISTSLFGLLLIIYIVVSVLLPDYKTQGGFNLWSSLWPILFFSDLPTSLTKAIKRKRFCLFGIWGLILGLYFLIAFFTGYWHPLWLILLIIPAYYCLFGPVDKYLSSKGK